MATITFKRTGTVNSNGSVPGELTIGNKIWPTIERGVSYTFVRKGTYQVTMDKKRTKRKIKCLRFDEDPAIQTHLVHAALNDNSFNLEGCIAPGQASHPKGIKGSAAAMEEILVALGGFVPGKEVSIEIKNNIRGNESKNAWIARRKK